MPKNRIGNSSKKGFRISGIAVIAAGFAVIVLAYFHFPQSFWNGGEPEIRWYELTGLEWNDEDEKAQFSVGIYEPDPGEPTAAELQEQLLEAYPDILSEITVNQKIQIERWVTTSGYKKDLADFMSSQYVQGFEDVYNLLYIEVVPTRPTAGYIAGSVCICAGVVLMLLSMLKRKKEPPESL